MATTKTKAIIRRNEFITPSVFEIDMELENRFDFEAGQFLMIKFKDSKEDKMISRAYSIASSPEKKLVTLCVKLVDGGKGTNYLKSLETGDTCDVSGPYGKFIYKTDTQRIPVFIATGTGIAPFLSMIESDKFKSSPPVQSHCILGVRTEDEILYQNDFLKVDNMNYVATVSAPNKWNGFKGRVTHYIQELNDLDWSLADFYLCGNGAMIKEVKEILGKKNVSPSNIFQEIYFT